MLRVEDDCLRPKNVNKLSHVVYRVCHVLFTEKKKYSSDLSSFIGESFSWRSDIKGVRRYFQEKELTMLLGEGRAYICEKWGEENEASVVSILYLSWW
jgi:hypothetical protein